MICSMVRAVNFVGGIFLVLLWGGQTWGQTLIQEGKFTLTDSTVFFVAAGKDRGTEKNYVISDIETYFYIRDRSSMPLENLLIGEVLANHKLQSNPSFRNIVERAFGKKRTDFAPKKKFLYIEVHISPVTLKIWSVTFLLKREKNDVTLEDLATIRHAIYQHYKPTIVSNSLFYMDYYDYLMDSTTIFYDDENNNEQQ